MKTNGFWTTQQEAIQSSSHNQTNNQYSPQLKVDIILNVQINVCKNQRQVLKWKNKGKRKESTWYDDELLKLFPAKWLDT